MRSATDLLLQAASKKWPPRLISAVSPPPLTPHPPAPPPQATQSDHIALKHETRLDPTVNTHVPTPPHATTACSHSTTAHQYSKNRASLPLYLVSNCCRSSSASSLYTPPQPRSSPSSDLPSLHHSYNSSGLKHLGHSSTAVQGAPLHVPICCRVISAPWLSEQLSSELIAGGNVGGRGGGDSPCDQLQVSLVKGSILTSPVPIIPHHLDNDGSRVHSELWVYSEL